MIEVQGLSKRYNNFAAVDQVSFQVQTGQTLALVGTSGSGKTTTLKMINRLIEPSEGKILLDGKNILDFAAEEIRRDMGYVIQSIGLFPHYTIEENIAIVPNLLKWDKQKTKERVHQLMEQLKIPAKDYAQKYPKQLSGGQQQRVGIARALAANPPIILMDEPFGALDPITRKDIRKDFLELEELSSKTTIMVTHDVEEAFEMADLICILDQGKIQQLATPKELLFEPNNTFVKSFLADKRLQLELHALTLNDLSDFLPDLQTPPPSPINIHSNTSVIEVIRIFTQHNFDQTMAKTQFEGFTKFYDFGTLMNSFQHRIAQLKNTSA